MERVPEAELMDVPLNASAYAGADFSEPNSKFVALFAEKFPAFNGQRLLDLGCGPADITVRFAHRYPQTRVLGVDGAEAMLTIARRVIREDPALANRIDVRKWHIGCEKSPLGLHEFDAVVSNSLLHHMDDPLDLWRTIHECAAPGAPVLVMDLIRPPSLSEAAAIVEKYADNEPEVLRVDFLNSLLAAYSLDEVRQQLSLANMGSLHIEVVSDRHFIVSGSLS